MQGKVKKGQVSLEASFSCIPASLWASPVCLAQPGTSLTMPGKETEQRALHAAGGENTCTLCLLPGASLRGF